MPEGCMERLVIFSPKCGRIWDHSKPKWRRKYGLFIAQGEFLQPGDYYYALCDTYIFFEPSMNSVVRILRQNLLPKYFDSFQLRKGVGWMNLRHSSAKVAKKEKTRFQRLRLQLPHLVIFSSHQVPTSCSNASTPK